jgi:hypothetical protein
VATQWAEGSQRLATDAFKHQTYITRIKTECQVIVSINNPLKSIKVSKTLTGPSNPSIKDVLTVA